MIVSDHLPGFKKIPEIGSGHNVTKKITHVIPKCKGKPMDRRDTLAFYLRPIHDLDFSSLIGQPKLSLIHLQHVFAWLIFGYCVSFMTFLFEVIWFKTCHERAMYYQKS